MECIIIKKKGVWIVINEKVFESILYYSPSPALILKEISNERYEYAFINSAYEKLKRIKNEDIIGKIVDRENIDNKFKSIFEALNIIIKNEKFLSEDYRFIIEEENKIFDIVATLIELNDERYITFCFHDITAHKLLEAKLIESNQILDVINEQTFISIFLHQHGAPKYVNKGLVKLLGYSESEILEWRSFDFLNYIYDEDREYVRTQALKKQSGEADYITSYSYRLIAKDGSIKWVQQYSKPILFEGDLAVLVILFDITEDKQIEEIKKKKDRAIELLDEAIEYDRLKTEFFANLSHELKTPLNVILGASQLMEIYLSKIEQTEETKKLQFFRESMKNNCYRLLRMINNLIDITSFDVGYSDMDYIKVEMKSFLNDTIKSVEVYAQNKMVEMKYITDIKEKYIVCDIHKIERIILNLLSNAFKFTKKGDKVIVSLIDLGDTIKISVKDTGIGIPKDMQDMIFERFRQVDKSFLRRHEGSGIGLSIVKSLVLLHGGNIKVYSEEGKGSEFSIELPVAPPDNKNINKNIYRFLNADFSERVKIELSDLT